MPITTAFELATEMESAISVTEECLKKMRDCCELEIPFHPATEMESVISVTEKCLRRMKGCCELAQRLGRLASYKRKRNTTRAMLLLMEYGSEDGFVGKVRAATSEFGSGLKDLQGYMAEIETTLLAKSSKCPTCRGTGNKVRVRVIRERGSQPHSVRQVTSCPNCGGSGRRRMEEELLEPIASFLEEAGKLLEKMRKFHQSLSDFASASIRRVQTMEKEKPKTRTLLERPLEAEPRQGEATESSVTKQEVTTKRIHEKMPKAKRSSRQYRREYFLNLLRLKRVTSYYSPASDGPSTWWERRSNKQYICSACNGFIGKGERYIGRKRRRPGMRAPHAYITDYYHIACLLKSSQAGIEEEIRTAHSRAAGLERERASLTDRIRSRRSRIGDCETLLRKVKGEYRDASFWRKIDKWASYRYTSRKKAGEVSRLEKEITRIERGEIPDREAQIAKLKGRIDRLRSWLAKIERERNNLLRNAGRT